MIADSAAETARPVPAISVRHGLSALDDLSSHWLALEAQGAPANLFQSHALTAIWARNFLKSPADGELLVLILHQDENPMLILPLVVEQHLGTRLARVTGAPIAQYAEALGPAEATPENSAALLAALRAAGIDAVHFQGIRAGSFLERFSARLGLIPGNKRAAPFAELGDGRGHEAFLRERSRSLAKKLRARQRQLQERGPVRFEVLEHGPAARQAMENAMHFKREWLARRGAMSTAFLDPLSAECLLDLAENLPGALLHVLRCGEHIVAIRLGFARHGFFFSYLSAYDESLAEFSPGKLLMDFTFSWARQQHFAGIDLLPPESDNKALWCEESTEVADYDLALSHKGRLYGALYQRGLRPLLRNLYYALPVTARQRLARRLLAGTEPD